MSAHYNRNIRSNNNEVIGHFPKNKINLDTKGLSLHFFKGKRHPPSPCNTTTNPALAQNRRKSKNNNRLERGSEDEQGERERERVYFLFFVELASGKIYYVYAVLFYL